ncbi:MAG: SOS response-associated peptidase [Acidobacteria bacterium]|nr:SOS response-associated peptidase [Acidobacteriota bacterium]
MCGRISQKGRRADFREFIYKFDPGEDLFRPNIKPTQTVQIVVNDDQEAHTVAAKWWFQKEGGKEFSTEYTTFNAAAEKLEKSFLWRGALHKRRCLVPVTSFYEWNVKGEPPLEIGMPERDRPFALAGLWSNFSIEGVHYHSFAIITTDPNAFMKPIHRRMPVVLGGLADQERWLNEGGVQMLLPFEGELVGEKLENSLEKMYPLTDQS